MEKIRKGVYFVKKQAELDRLLKAGYKMSGETYRISGKSKKEVLGWTVYNPEEMNNASSK